MAETCDNELTIQKAKQYGLGVGLDMTVLDPWKSKGAYDVRKSAKKGDIFETSLGRSQERMSSVVTSRDLIFKADGNLGVEVLSEDVKLSMDAAVSRKYAHSQAVNVTEVYTRKVCFKVPSSDESFETELCDYIKFDDTRKDAGYKHTLKQLCEKFVQEHAITHFTKGIFLGAMKCEVQNFDQRSTRVSGGGTLAPRVLPAKAQAEGEYTAARSSTLKVVNTIGRYESNDTNLIVTKEEVISAEFAPIYTLVKTPNLAEALKDAVAMYCNEKLPKRKFSYFVHSVSLEPPHTVYWLVQ